MSDARETDLYGEFDLEEFQDLDEVDNTQLVQPESDGPHPATQSSVQQGDKEPVAFPPAGQSSKIQPQYPDISQAQNQMQGFQGQQGSGQYGQNLDMEGMDRTRPSDMPDEGKMFIGGLNWETTDEKLRAYMSEFGEIDACTVMRDPTGRSRGFAFLTYVDPASVTKVLGQTHHLDGKQIDPKRAIPRAEHEKTAKVFVGGLAATVTSESLRTFLSTFGGVLDATVMIDRDTNRSKGFAFATFENEDGVLKAMEASGSELDGKQIEIRKAQPRGAGTQPGKFSTNRNNFNNNMGGPMGGGMGNPGMGGGFDPNAMAMMYQNMMKNTGMGMGMGGGGFDPNSMAMMYQNMMKSMGGMGNAPAINPGMMRNNMGMGNMMGMGMMGMNGMGMGGMPMAGAGGVGGAMGAVPMAGGFQNPGGPGRNGPVRPIPNAPRGPAAMRAPGQNPPTAQGPGAQRYTTQGAARSKPY
ncbi:hypothetical protein TREMEDRAFT_74094 [Tremella mesenterica DSM 1558]|uniref:uncharacterized protein n=1 Tax=Tremella mesenterica (strain ATCC 24925 / CBS 8224 / DSM 1558 / NBRC 9311 / NRRL Y-6157 / RJB 2259-6 / UBC 559-6) TaxID=578456 RepID=UPI0003F4A31B|nr:uncharacterized protein TREMEDRAFT_74094 [Tremella mesenterica DSM 1558]EIW68566.1 hypothetical protein TREMEDRAFT_74094 [Tremella mesenterica DSM 1558]